MLPNGKVLIAGGYIDNDSILASSEVYDPTTRAFIATGNMTTPRMFHTATLLPNGKVLIAGGNMTPFSFLASSELYDPATGAFTLSGDMTKPRAMHSSTLLSSGLVLICGGCGSNAAYLCGPSAELYDPTTGTYRATGDMATERFASRLALLPSGKVLLAGGYGLEGPIPWVEIYDPDAGVFSFAGGAKNTTEALGIAGYTTATLLPQGQVLRAGYEAGYYLPSLAQPSSESYDPAAGTFSPTGDMVTPRSFPTATLLPDSTVLMSGGAPLPFAGANLASAEIYHPAVLGPSPLLFSLSGDQKGQGAILHAGTSQVVSAADPGVAGELLEIYGTGLIDGAVIPPQVSIGDRMSEVLFFGKAPEFAGLNQINARVPSGVAPGPSVPVRLNYLARPSNEVTIGIK
jgi:hypothetical protein